MNIIIKVLLSAFILPGMVVPYPSTFNEAGTLETVFTLGITGSVILFALFFLAIGFYCKELQNCLVLISPQNRKASPRSVWFMFLIPFNFIEDFFIAINLFNSMEEAKCNKKLSGIKDLGMISGIGWCIAQIFSLIPNIAGQLAGALGLVLWIIHWRLIIKINKLLTQ